MAYGSDLADIYRGLANVIGTILRGANPGDIPFYQPTKFELSINLKTAKALGLSDAARPYAHAGSPPARRDQATPKSRHFHDICRSVARSDAEQHRWERF